MSRRIQIYYSAVFSAIGGQLAWFVVGLFPTASWNLWIATAFIGAGAGLCIGAAIGVVDGWWRLIDQAGEIGKLIDWGRVPNLDLRQGSANLLRLIVKDKRGQFLVNREVVAELDLSTQVGAGDVLIATGFYPGDERDGQATAYRDFTVWSTR